MFFFGEPSELRLPRQRHCLRRIRYGERPCSLPAHYIWVSMQPNYSLGTRGELGAVSNSPFLSSTPPGRFFLFGGLLMAIDCHLLFSLYNSSAVKDGQGWKLEDQRWCGRSPQDHGRGDEAAQDRLRWVDVDGKQGVIITLSMLSPKTNIPTHFLLKRAAYNIFVTVGWHSPGSATLFFFRGEGVRCVWLE